MELLKIFLLGPAYVCLVTFLGRFFFSLLKIDLHYKVLQYSVGFLVVEGLSFLSFVIFGLLGYKNFSFSFLPVLILLFLYLFFALRTRQFFFTPLRVQYKALWFPGLFVFITLTLLYFINASGQFFAVLNFEGMIYQDIVYHAGIAQSMINFGYPVLDLQYAGKQLNYHLFTHFLAAKFSYISFSNPFISYHVFLNFLGAFFYSFLSVSLVRTLLKTKIGIIKHHDVWISAICLAAFFCTFLVGGVLSYGYIAAFYFSASFQWQLIIIIAYFMVVRQIISHGDYSQKNNGLLLILLFVATITKVSSLPLIYSGILALLLYSFFYWKKREWKYWGQLSLFSGLIGILIYWGFFKGNNSESSLLEFNLDLAESTPVVAFFDLSNPVLIFTIYFFIVLSFRIFLVWRIKEYDTWFGGGVLVAGFLLSLLFKENQVYFLFPSIAVGSHVALVYLLSLKKQKLIIVPALVILLLSFYPVGGLGTFIHEQLEDREDYFPMTEERAGLYEWLRNNSSEEEIIFTTSVYANPEMMADNFFPAAMTGRRFYLGGYRFGGLENLPEFSKRLHLVQNFDINNREIWSQLVNTDVNYVLIEERGNFNIDLWDQLENFEKNEYYERVYRNDYGIILKVIKE